jgi:hypothetical protein
MSYPNEPSGRADPSSTTVRGTDTAGAATDPRRVEHKAENTARSAADPNTTTGATRVAERKGGGGRWLLALLGLVVLALLAWGLTQCANNSARQAVPPPAAPAAAPDTGVPGANAPAVVPGSLTVGDRSLFPLSGVAAADGSLSALAGQGATARGVRVLSVPADEGFWMGTNDTDRVWVKLIPNGESPVNVNPGELLDFTGSFVAHDPQFAGAEGIDAAEGADQLTRQGAHIEAAQEQVRITGNG